MNAEEPIRPTRNWRPAAAMCERLKRLDRIFVAAFGVDGLAGAKLDGGAAHPHLLPLRAGKMHLDAAAAGVEESVVLERGEIEIGTELAIDAREQIEIELGGDAF